MVNPKLSIMKRSFDGNSSIQIVSTNMTYEWYNLNNPLKHIIIIISMIY